MLVRRRIEDDVKTVTLDHHEFPGLQQRYPDVNEQICVLPKSNCLFSYSRILPSQVRLLFSACQPELGSESRSVCSL